MSVGDSVQLACRDSLLPFLQQEARAAGAGGSGGGGGGAGSDGGEVKLLEVDESMLAELLRDGENVVIQDKKPQNVTIPRVAAAAVASSHLEVVPVAPRLARLTHLLSACAYNERDEEEELRGGEGEGEEGEGGGEGGGGRRGDGGMGGGGMYNGVRKGVGEGGNGKTGRRKGCTWQELVGRVQASEEEIRAGLEAAGAVKIGDMWRGVDPAYLASLLHLLLLTAAANDWPPRAIPEAATVAAMCGEGGKGEGGKTEGGERMRGEREGEEGEGERREGPRAELVRHCLKVFGTGSRLSVFMHAWAKQVLPTLPHARTIACMTILSPRLSLAPLCIRESMREKDTRWRLSAFMEAWAKSHSLAPLCFHGGMGKKGTRWRLSSFMEAWAKKVPPAMAQSLDATWLRGLAVLQHVGGPAAAAAAAAAAATVAGKTEEEQECEPLGGAQSTWLRFLPSDQLPATAEHRFQALFNVQPMWALGDLEPYLMYVPQACGADIVGQEGQVGQVGRRGRWAGGACRAGGTGGQEGQVGRGGMSGRWDRWAGGAGGQGGHVGQEGQVGRRGRWAGGACRAGGAGGQEGQVGRRGRWAGGAQSTWLHFLPSDQLPATAEHRFQALFSMQLMWTLGDLEPYLV
ncbi:unnamed protein product [Closterium sp. Naga37s-1]|nr:unnamed protein product [Closterium sp. Naga37s-1]